MKKIFGILFTAVLLASCVKEECTDCNFEPLIPVSADRVYFHYMATDNTLSSFADVNINAMQRGMGDVETNGVVIVFRDVTNQVSQLIIIFNDIDGNTQKRVLKTYSENLDSSDPEVFKRVLADAKDAVESRHWVLGFGSHGLGWIPYSMLTKYGSRSAKSLGGPATRVLIQDDNLGQTKVMEIDEFAGMLTDGDADLILMDLCLMGGVEFAYELKDKADYLVMSPAEVLAAGFPYDKIMDDIFNGTIVEAAEGVCVEYNEHYKSINGFGTIAMIDCSKMDAFTQDMKTVLANAPDEINVRGMLCYDRFSNHITFDMGAFITLLGGDPTIMNDLVPPEFALSTEKPLMGFVIPQEGCSGLSTYIPLEAYADLNVEYAKTKWYKAISGTEE